MLDERDPMQRHHQKPLLPTSRKEIEIRSKLFLIGWLLLPWAFMTMPFMPRRDPKLIVLIPAFIVTATGIICVKSGLPKEIRRKSSSGDIYAAAQAVGWHAPFWMTVMRLSYALVIASFVLAFIRST